MGEVNQARAYGVRVLPTSARPGEAYWRIVEVRHLTPAENRGKHNIYVDAVDEHGQRVRNRELLIAYTWEGRRADEPAPPRPLDKPDSEPAGNIEINLGQVIRLWLADQQPSDAVEGIHTNHPDELGPAGERWNSIGHHSFYVKFQRTAAVGVDGDNGGDNGSGGNGGSSPNGDLVAMVQALHLEVTALRRWQNTMTAWLERLTGEL